MKKKINIHIENPCTSGMLCSTKKIVEYFLSRLDIIEKSCLNGFDYNALSFDVLLCDNKRIQKLNKEYRQKNQPTDVITFALFADSEPRFVTDGEIYLGEIIISTEKVKQQAQENGYFFEHELYCIVSHGILHLLGFEHSTQEEYEFMVENQNESLKETNVKIQQQKFF